MCSHSSKAASKAILASVEILLTFRVLPWAGIEKCYIIEGPKDPANPSLPQPPAIQTDGINFEGAWSADDVLDVNCLVTNDVGSILRTYGVEAARATLMREVSSVFGAYGIGVDPRHLGLIADFMTHQASPQIHNYLQSRSASVISASPALSQMLSLA